MKPAATQKFPSGWSDKRVRALIDYYDNQTDDEGAAEIETAPEASRLTWMSVPTKLVPAIARLIEEKDAARLIPGRVFFLDSPRSWWYHHLHIFRDEFPCRESTQTAMVTYEVYGLFSCASFFVRRLGLLLQEQ